MSVWHSVLTNNNRTQRLHYLLHAQYYTVNIMSFVTTPLASIWITSLCLSYKGRVLIAALAGWLLLICTSGSQTVSYAHCICHDTIGSTDL